MYTKKETILLPLFMRRVIVKPFKSHRAKYTPEKVGVFNEEGGLQLVVHFDIHLPLGWTEYQRILFITARYYGLTLVRIHTYFAHELIDAPLGDYTIYRDLTTTGELKLID